MADAPFNSTPRAPAMVPPPALTPQDHQDLRRAVALLEHTSFAQRLAQTLGRQVDLIGRFVPTRFASLATKAASLALKGALHTALTTLDKRQRAPNLRLHKTLAMASGALGGAFGLAALPVELPISTGILLRAIADIARAEGEDLRSPDTALACLQVFALSGQSDAIQSQSSQSQASQTQDGVILQEGGYFAVRAVLAASMSEAARYALDRGVVSETAPAVVRLISLIAARFGLVVSQKAMAQAIPVLGAASGAAVNYAFTQHFQGLAQGHFTVRRLERLYGQAQVKEAYEQIVLEAAGNQAKLV